MKCELTISNPQAIILGVNHHNTYGIIRSLAKIHIKPIVIINECKNNCFYRKSRYIKQLMYVPFDNIVEWLINYGQASGKIRHTLYISSDALSELVDQNQNILKSYYNLPCSGYQGMLSKVMDKQIMGDFAIKSGLTIPYNCKTYDVHELSNDAINLNYPCIIKPIKSSKGHKSDINICYNDADLKMALSKITCDKVQIQDYIDKDFEFQLIGLSLNKGNNIIIPGITKVIWSASNNSNTGIVEIRPIDPRYQTLINQVTQFIQSFEYTGSFSVEFLKSKNGTYFFMEINFRNDGNAIVVTAAGVNLPQIWWEYHNSQQKYKINKCQIRQKTIATPFWNMLPCARKENSIFKMIKYSMRSKIFMDFTLFDPEPFFLQLYQRLKTHLL